MKDFMYYDAVLETKEQAEEMLCTMKDILRTYGYVTVYDFYNLAGSLGYMAADRYRGWRKLGLIKIERNRYGTYSLKLPKPIKLKFK